MVEIELSRRTYLIIKATEIIQSHVPIPSLAAAEAVDATAAEHPEIDMTEKRTWAQWEDDEQILGL